MFVDLCISLTLAMLAITTDARSRGKASWPYWVLALLTGSIGPLIYWMLNPPGSRQPPAPSPQRPGQNLLV